MQGILVLVRYRSSSEKVKIPFQIKDLKVVSYSFHRNCKSTGESDKGTNENKIRL